MLSFLCVEAMGEEAEAPPSMALEVVGLIISIFFPSMAYAWILPLDTGRGRKACSLFFDFAEHRPN